LQQWELPILLTIQFPEQAVQTRQRETATRQVEQEEQQVEKSAGDPLMRSSQLGRYLEKDLICCWQLPRVLWGKPTERAGLV
jgi:hypothetical protein